MPQECETSFAPRFSVIVPVYNVQNYLAACVKSVVEQPGARDWECILVDDGSTDKSGAMCDAFAKLLPGVTVIHQENKGLAGARNTGIAAAKGEWLLFLDSDDFWPQEMLPKLRTALDEHPGFDWYAGRYRQQLAETGEIVEPNYHFVPGEFEHEKYSARVKRLYDSCGWSVWKFCLNRRWLAETGVTFCEEVRWAEDWPFDLELLHRCKRLCFVDVVFTVYRADRVGSLMTAGLAKHFIGIQNALHHFEPLFAAGDYTEAEQKEILSRAADVFWPQARSAAVKDTAVRRACVEPIRGCRKLYPYGEKRAESRSQQLFAGLLTAFGPRFALWAGAAAKREES